MQPLTRATAAVGGARAAAGAKLTRHRLFCRPCRLPCAPPCALLDRGARRLVDGGLVYEEVRAWPAAAVRAAQHTPANPCCTCPHARCGSFAQLFPVRCYEVASDRSAIISSIANLLQEVAANHAQLMWGEGTWAPPVMAEQNMAFALSKLHIRMDAPVQWCVASTAKRAHECACYSVTLLNDVPAVAARRARCQGHDRALEQLVWRGGHAGGSARLGAARRRLGAAPRGCHFHMAALQPGDAPHGAPAARVAHLVPHRQPAAATVRAPRTPWESHLGWPL